MLWGLLARFSQNTVPEPIANQGIVGKWNQLPVRSSGSLSDMESGLLRSSNLDSFEGVGRVSMSRSPSVENLASSLSHSLSLGNVEKGLAVGTGGVVAYNIYKGKKKSKMEKTLEPLADKLGA